MCFMVFCCVLRYVGGVYDVLGCVYDVYDVFMMCLGCVYDVLGCVYDVL